MPHLPQSLSFDFDAPVPPVPFAPGSHTSFVSALIEARSTFRGRKTRAYLLALAAAGSTGLSDQEAAAALTRRLVLPRGRCVPVQSICSIRAAVAEALLLEKGAIVTGDFGRPVQRWRLNAAGQAAAVHVGDRR